MRPRPSFNPRHRFGKEAAALLLVLWVLGILLLLLVGLTGLLGDNALSASSARATVNAWIQANSGLAIASDPNISPTDPLLQSALEESEGFSVQILSESARPDLNALLQSQAGIDTLESLFQIWGLGPQTAQVLVERMADYVDPDDDTRLNGAEAPAYEQIGRKLEPTNKPFQSVEDARVVIGADVLDTVLPDWQNRFTIYGGNIDLSQAEADVIAAVSGLGLSTAQQFVNERNGQDGKVGTKDDRPFASVDEALQLLGIPAARIPVTITGSVLRIESMGWTGQTKVTITVIKNRGESSNSHWLSYEERKY